MKFQSTTDFQVEAETGEATRVPTLEEEEKLNEFLEMRAREYSQSNEF